MIETFALLRVLTGVHSLYLCGFLLVALWNYYTVQEQIGCFIYTGGCIQADETVVICITYFADCIDNWRGSFLVYI